MILPAIGQMASVEPARGIDLTDGRTVRTDMATLQTSAPDVFAGGDVVNGGGTAIEAIASGQRAAVAIDRRLGGKGALPPEVNYSLRRPTEEELEKIAPRAEEEMLPVAERRRNFREIVRGLSPASACAEAGRCLRCDLERRM
jgi:NADPH-dependent glutamate synthase beta subunit-like oxidoreductase